jgi:hypothetical protein
MDFQKDDKSWGELIVKGNQRIPELFSPTVNCPKPSSVTCLKKKKKKKSE